MWGRTEEQAVWTTRQATERGRSKFGLRVGSDEDDGRGTSLRVPRARSRSLALRLTLYVPTSSRRLIKKCKKPDKTEFLKVARLTAVGFLAVGCLGFFVKLIFIPINQIIVSSQS